jgi:Uma2 family endonuclease
MIARRATVDDLYRFDGKAELINGELVPLMATGGKPGYAGDVITASLLEYAEGTEDGFAVGDGKGFLVDLPHRESFSPDAAYFTGDDPDMRFYDGAPVFAVEVRSENDYGPSAEEQMEAKRADYFATGTLVVWDVDLLSEDVVKVYRATDPETPTIYRRGEVAEVEPAVPGWTLRVDRLFRRPRAGRPT